MNSSKKSISNSSNQRRRLKPSQKKLLEDFFEKEKYPSAADITTLCEGMPELGMGFIRTWFQNKRFRSHSNIFDKQNSSNSDSEKPKKTKKTVSPKSSKSKLNFEDLKIKQEQTPINTEILKQEEIQENPIHLNPNSDFLTVINSFSSEEYFENQFDFENNTLSDSLMSDGDLTPLNNEENLNINPLIVAVLNRSNFQVSQLVSNKENINAIDNFGRTPLHYACFIGDFHFVCVLLSAGANFLLKDYFSLTPREISQIQGFHEISDLLLKFENSTLNINSSNNNNNNTEEDISNFSVESFFVDTDLI